MAGLFGVLDVAAGAMQVVQGGVRTTGHNIANAGTPGYSRQRQVLEATRPLPLANGALGMGVEQRSIQRITDGFVQAQLVQQNATGGALDTQAQALSVVEEVLNEQQGDGVGNALTALYTAFGDLASAASPGATVERGAVLGAAQRLVDAVHRADARLRNEQDIAEERIGAVVGEVNLMAERIAELNGEIARQETLTPANDLRDQRDQLLRDLARKVDVQSFELPNGSAVVLLSGGPVLVEGVVARQLRTEADPANPPFSRVMFDDGSSSRDVTAEIGGGELGGLLRVRDTLLPSAIRSLDVLAYNLHESVNTVHAAGFGLDGSTGNPFFTPLAVVEDAARDLAVDPALLANPDTLAAGALGPDPGDNENALALAGLRDVQIQLALPGDPPGPPTGPTRTLVDHAAAIVADVGLQARGVQDAAEQNARVREILENRREEVSGVSLDEEVTDLVRLQAAFQANARIVSVVDRLLQDVIGML